MESEACVPISTESDIIVARQKGRQIAERLGFSSSDQTVVATAISEIARNILIYAQRGEILLDVAERDGRKGIVVVARDQGPGIPDVARAMEDGYSTSKSLGLGLPGARRLMDDFEIVSQVGMGTTITMTKWTR